MSALDPRSILGLVRSSSRPRVPLPSRRCTQPALPFVVSLASVIMLALLAVVFFYPGAALGQGNAPATPSSVSVTRADGSLTASWPAVTDATSYHVTYSSDGMASWNLAALNHAGTSITISADNAKTYVVGVRARNDSGDSGWVNSAPAGPYTPPKPDPTPEPTPPPAPPAPPASVSVTRSAGTLEVSWPGGDGCHILQRQHHRRRYAELAARRQRRQRNQRDPHRHRRYQDLLRRRPVQQRGRRPAAGPTRTPWPPCRNPPKPCPSALP